MADPSYKATAKGTLPARAQGVVCLHTSARCAWHGTFACKRWVWRNSMCDVIVSVRFWLSTLLDLSCMAHVIILRFTPLHNTRHHIQIYAFTWHTHILSHPFLRHCMTHVIISLNHCTTTLSYIIYLATARHTSSYYILRHCTAHGTRHHILYFVTAITILHHCMTHV